MPGYHCDLQHDADYLAIPERIDEEELERRVVALRLGDRTQANKISVMLLRLTMSLVSNFAHPRRTPDLIGVATLTLVESVNAAAVRLTDNNIIPFVSTHINMRLKDAIAKDHVVCIPPRTLRSFRQQGIEAFVPLTTASCGYEGIARPEGPSLEFTDMMNKIVRNDRERLVLNMRAERHGLAVIAESMGVSIALVHKLKAELRSRYSALNID